MITPVPIVIGKKPSRWRSRVRANPRRSCNSASWLMPHPAHLLGGAPEAQERRHA
jgi:hypothetical protein